MNTRIQLAEQFCSENGIRLTTKRKQVLNGLLIADRALSAYELIEVCREHFDAVIPAMSVYRILDFLKEQHLVHKIEVSNKFIACSQLCLPSNCQTTTENLTDKEGDKLSNPAPHKHQHDLTQFLICDQCHRVEEIDIKPTVAKQLRQSINSCGFVTTNNQLEVRCLCTDCYETKKH